MRRIFLLVGIAIISGGISFGQKGTAEPDNYPQNYAGDVWTGVVTSANEDTREFILTYKKKDKEETFTGVLPKEYRHKMADGKYHQVNMDDLMGMTIRVYYMAKTRKVNDQKIKYSEVFKIKIIAPAKP
jgi:hypothetical protein